MQVPSRKASVIVLSQLRAFVFSNVRMRDLTLLRWESEDQNRVDMRLNIMLVCISIARFQFQRDIESGPPKR